MPLGQKMNLSQAERLRRAQRAIHAKKFVDPKKHAAATRKVGLANVASGHLEAIRTPEICSLGGSTSRDLKVGVHGMSHQQLSFVGKSGGKIGGPIQGARNAESGWMRHIVLLRYEKSHEDCTYCINCQRTEECSPTTE